MKPLEQHISAKALGLLYRDGPNGREVLASAGFDKNKNEHFYRLIGGGIEFGETSASAVIREFMEELKAEVTIEKFHGWLENIFTYNGQQGHQLMAIYDVRFRDKTFEQQDVFHVEEAYGRFEARWVNMNDVKAGRTRLYPAGMDKFY